MIKSLKPPNHNLSKITLELHQRHALLKFEFYEIQIAHVRYVAHVISFITLSESNFSQAYDMKPSKINTQ